MNFNYIDSLGNLNKIFINGLFFKFFFNFNILYQFFFYYNSYYVLNLNFQKNRSFVNYSTKKIYKQKGTGRSRQGSKSSPTRVGGGVAFPNHFYINSKINFNKFFYKLSYFFIYSNIFLNNYFFLMEDIFFLEIKTKLLFYFFNFSFKKILFLSLKIEKNFFLSLNNFKNFFIFYFFNFNPLLLLKFSNIFVTRSCFEYFND